MQRFAAFSLPSNGKPGKRRKQAGRWARLVDCQKNAMGEKLKEPPDWQEFRNRLLSACGLKSFEGSISSLLAIYYQTPRWKRVSANMRRNYRLCQFCGSSDRLTVHHRRYDTVGKEFESDLIVLCWECHQRLHRSMEARKAGVELKPPVPAKSSTVARTLRPKA